jgi:pimeloyl-ACP methyl ester carboxylesterase
MKASIKIGLIVGLPMLAWASGLSHPAAASDAPVVIKEQGAFFVGGKYDNPANPRLGRMYGQMYVRFQIPQGGGDKKYPVVMIHGGGQQNTSFTGTPDDRMGWADYFLSRGWPVYTVDQPGRGRAPYNNSVYGARTAPPNVTSIENLFTAPERANLYPQAHLHTQWPGTGVHGDPVFDQFFASQFSGMEALPQENFTTSALVALLEKIGPAILLTHSQSGPHGWTTADARPDLVKAIIAVEPNGPPFYNEANTAIERPWGLTRLPLTFSPAATDPSQLQIEQQTAADGPGLFRCWRQTNPARKLPNLAGVPILLVTGEASFRAQYDHCTSQFLTQAGVPNEHLRLETVGIHGNGHMMMLEKNNGEIADVLLDWLKKNVDKNKVAKK